MVPVPEDLAVRRELLVVAAFRSVGDHRIVRVAFPLDKIIRECQSHLFDVAIGGIVVVVEPAFAFISFNFI